MDSQELANYVISQQINYNQKILFFVAFLLVYGLYYLLTDKYKEEFFIMNFMNKFLFWAALPILSFTPLYVLLLDNGFNFYVLSDYLIYLGGFAVAVIPLIFITGLGEKILKFIKEKLIRKIMDYFHGVRK